MIAPRTTQRNVVTDALLTGLLGAATLAIWFLILDVLVRGTPFFTPSLLAGMFFDGAGVEHVEVTMKNVYAFSVIHVGAFLFMGALIALMFREFELMPNFGIAYLLLFVTFEIVIFGVQIAMMPQIIGTIGTWATALGNTIAALAMYFYMLNRYPDSWSHLVTAWQASGSKQP